MTEKKNDLKDILSTENYETESNSDLDNNIIVPDMVNSYLINQIYNNNNKEDLNLFNFNIIEERNQKYINSVNYSNSNLFNKFNDLVLESQINENLKEETSHLASDNNNNNNSKSLKIKLKTKKNIKSEPKTKSKRQKSKYALDNEEKGQNKKIRRSGRNIMTSEERKIKAIQSARDCRIRKKIYIQSIEDKLEEYTEKDVKQQNLIKTLSLKILELENKIDILKGTRFCLLG